MLLLREQIIILGIMLVLSAFFSGSETAIMGIGRLKAIHLLEKKKKGAKTLMKLKDEVHRTLTTILIGNNVVNVGASVLATSIAFELFSNYALSATTGILTLLILVFGEITPKSLATIHMEKFALIAAKPIYWLSILLFPIIWFFDVFTRLLTRNVEEKPLITEDEIKTIVRAGEEVGAIEEEEHKMIQRVFKFDDINVSEVMTPRPDMISINQNASLKDLKKIVNKHAFSKIPVYDKTKDHIVGVVFTKDLLKQKDLNKKVNNIILKIHFVPETQKLDTLLGQLKKRKESIAIVVDEHGTVAGLVTIDDLLEEIVGEIVTEKDKVSPSIKKTGKKTWIVEGKTDIQEVNSKLKSKFKEEEDFETIGGYVLDKLERIPKEGDKLSVGKYTFSVIKLSGKRIKEIKIEKK